MRRELRARFEALRIEVLAQHVRRETLREDVRHMRNRMRRELSRAGPGEFDLKQDPGGIADIEFLAQYWALRWAQDYPPVAMFSDTIRQLESVASADLVPQEQIDVLTGTYRRLSHAACTTARSTARGAVVAGGRIRGRARRRGRASGTRSWAHDARAAIIVRMDSPANLRPANAQNQYTVTRQGPAAVLSDAGHEPVEFASARLSADRGHRLRQVPVLRRRIHAAALSSAGAPTQPCWSRNC